MKHIERGAFFAAYLGRSDRSIIIPCRNTPVPSRFTSMKKILAHEFALFAEPGALIAMLLVLLMIGAGGAAMAIAARGWPF